MDLKAVWAEAWRQGPFAGLLLCALVTGYSGIWVWGANAKTVVDQCAEDKKELRDQRDEYKRIAFNAVGFVNEQAQQSAKVNEQVVSPSSKPKPVIATVKIPFVPLTQVEKREIQRPQDAEPATLDRTLGASQKVLLKTDVSNAVPVKKN